MNEKKHLDEEFGTEITLEKENAIIRNMWGRYDPVGTQTIEIETIVPLLKRLGFQLNASVYSVGLREDKYGMVKFTDFMKWLRGKGLEYIGRPNFIRRQLHKAQETSRVHLYDDIVRAIIHKWWVPNFFYLLLINISHK